MLRLPALLVTIAALLVAGCGGDDRLSKAEYVKQFKAVVTKGQEEGQAAQSKSGDVAQLEALKGAVTKIVDGLDDLEPPEEVETAHEDFVSVIRYVNDTRITKALDALREKDTQAAQEAFTKDLPANLKKKQSDAQARFRKLDYDLGQDAVPTGG